MTAREITRSPSPTGATAPDPRRLPRLLATGADPSLGGHLNVWGPMPRGPVAIREIERAGLRGRGGAGFPTAKKVAAVATRRRAVVVANGTEGEPASWKDKILLSRAPHLVLDGLHVAATTVRAEEAIICVDRSASAVVEAVQRAAAERAGAGTDRLPTQILVTPPRYVAGEESALVHWLNGEEAKPTFVPPRPFERGVRGRPTLVNNVETLAHLALIARFGARWYRFLGTADSPGTALVSVAGDVVQPGVYEIAFGTPIEEVLGASGAGPTVHAVLVGGYAGTWMPVRAARALHFDATSLARAGASIGCASLLVLDQRSCGLDATARIAGWMAEQSAGQCGPCAKGLPAIAGGLLALASGDRGGREDQLRRWVDQVDGRGACHHPDGVARMVRSALHVFSGEIVAHARHGTCGTGSPGLPLPALPESWR